MAVDICHHIKLEKELCGGIKENLVQNSQELRIW